MAISKYLLAGMLVLIAGCRSAQKATDSRLPADQLARKITAKLGEDYQQAENYDHTMVLAWREDTSPGLRIVRFGVWRLSNGELVYAGAGKNGKVEWLDNTHLLLEDYPGIVDGDQQQYRFKIDLTTQTKIPIDESEKK